MDKTSTRRSDSYYGADLAMIHQEAYTDIAVGAASFVGKQLVRAGHGSGHIVDLGCGSGQMARRLSDQGYRVTGVDVSVSMLELARQHAPDVHFVEASFLDYAIPSCMAVTAIGEVFGYLFDQRNSAKTVEDLFARIYDQLESSGLLIFDLLAPSPLNEPSESAKQVEADDWTMHIVSREDGANRQLQRDITVFRKLDCGCYQKSNERHRIRLHPPESIRRVLEGIGFEVRLAEGYGNLKLRPNHYVVIAQK